VRGQRAGRAPDKILLSLRLTAFIYLARTVPAGVGHSSLDVTTQRDATMDIAGRDRNKFRIIDISGKIDRLKDSIVLKSQINTLIEKNHLNVALNLSKVTYLDSGALNVIIYCHNTLKKLNGKLVLIEPNEYVQDVLDVVGLTKVVSIYSTEEEFEHGTKNT
jgi:anti-anti-sigma factor